MGSGPRKTRKRRKTDDKDQGQEDLQGGPKRPRELYRIDRGTGLPRQNLEKIEMEDTTSTSPPDPGIPHSETNITTSTPEENGSLPVIVPENEEIDEEHLICEPDLPRRPARRQASIRGQEKITKSRMVTAAPISKRVEKPRNVPLSGSEKAKLLTAINMYGSRDHEAISGHIPLRSTET